MADKILETFFPQVSVASTQLSTQKNTLRTELSSTHESLQQLTLANSENSHMIHQLLSSGEAFVSDLQPISFELLNIIADARYSFDEFVNTFEESQAFSNQLSDTYKSYTDNEIAKKSDQFNDSNMCDIETIVELDRQYDAEKTWITEKVFCDELLNEMNNTIESNVQVTNEYSCPVLHRENEMPTRLLCLAELEKQNSTLES